MSYDYCAEKSERLMPDWTSYKDGSLSLCFDGDSFSLARRPLGSVGRARGSAECRLSRSLVARSPQRWARGFPAHFGGESDEILTDA